ncbi:MAG TPA: lipopolysaccharide biosynthesis protein [Acetobacteraceae bacterium]|nr:lipopolysaccharide biosynthesis protein [Acetobacteraceae bacterium]
MTVADARTPIETTTPPPSHARSAHATLWALVDQASGQGSAFAIFLVLARIIGPAQYGVFALSMSVLTLLTIVQYYGFADAIVQRAHIDTAFLDTVFWCDLALALVLALAAQAIATPVAWLFAAPIIAPMIRVLSVLCILQALVTVQTALYRRALRMRILALRTLLSYAFGGAAGIALALAHYGVWALVAAQVVQYAVILLVMWSCSSWRPGLHAGTATLRELLHFAGHFMFANGLKQSAERISQLLVGLFVDAAGVGCYAMAVRIMVTATTVAISPIERVALPVLSRFVDDLPEFRRTYRRMILVVDSIWTPAAIGLGIGAPVLVPVLFGSRWSPAIAVLEAMCFTAPTLALWYLNGAVLAALGKPERFTWLAIAYVALGCVAFPVAARFGIVAAGAAWAVISLLMVPLHLLTLRRACGLALRGMLSDWARISGAAAGMLAIMLVIDSRLAFGIPSLLVTWAAGSLTYLLLLQFVLMPGYVSRMLGLLRSAMLPGAVPREEAI